HLSLFLSTDPSPPPLSPLSLHDALPIFTAQRLTCCCRTVHREPITLKKAQIASDAAMMLTCACQILECPVSTRKAPGLARMRYSQTCNPPMAPPSMSRRVKIGYSRMETAPRRDIHTVRFAS